MEKMNRPPITMEEFEQKYTVYQIVQAILKVSITDYTRQFGYFESNGVEEVTEVCGLQVYNDETGKLELVVEDTMTDREYLDLLKEKFNIIDL